MPQGHAGCNALSNYIKQADVRIAKEHLFIHEVAPYRELIKAVPAEKEA